MVAAPCLGGRPEPPGALIGTRANFAVADLAEAERELKARGIYYWIYDSLVGDTSKQVFFEDPFGNMIELQQQGRGHDAPVR